MYIFFCNTEETVFILAPLANEYQVAFLKRDCVKTFKKMMKTGDCSLKKQLDIYFFTETYIGCQETMNFCADFLCKFSLAKLMQESVYGKLQQKGIILERRLEMIEKVTTYESVRILNENVIRMEKSCRNSVKTMPHLKSQWTQKANECKILIHIGEPTFESIITCIGCLTIVHDNIQYIVRKRIEDMSLKPQHSDSV